MNDLRNTALFFIAELRNDGAARKDIVNALVEELAISKANAAYYVDRVAKQPKVVIAAVEAVADQQNASAEAANEALAIAELEAA